MSARRMVFLFLLGFLVLCATNAAEYKNGSLVLVLNEKNGRFSLYTVGDTNGDVSGQGRRTPLLADEDPRTSFLAVMVNDRSYKLGDASAFKIRLGGDDQKPSLVFESSILQVTEEFSFIQNQGPLGNEGITITITMQNRQDRSINAGARYLLDTCLSEGSPDFPMFTNRQTIASEVLLTKAGGDTFWTDRNKNLSLTGSLDTDVLIANWKRLSEASWKTDYRPGRNFNFPPYSMGDIAVCYYFEISPLGAGESRSFGFSLYVKSQDAASPPPAAPLTAAGVAGAPVLPPSVSPVQAAGPAVPSAKEQDLAAVRELMARMDAGLSSGTVTPEELASIESALNELRARYGLGSVR